MNYDIYSEYWIKTNSLSVILEKKKVFWVLWKMSTDLKTPLMSPFIVKKSQLSYEP